VGFPKITPSTRTGVRGYAAAGMPMTPWGSSETLRERQLRPGPGVPRDEVERNQRERLYGAMVAACDEKGYLGTSVSDVIAVAGVSRGTFYKYFEDKEACFTAALDEIIAAALTVVETTVAESEGAEIPPQGLSAFLQLMVWQPAGARACFIEVYAAGPRAIAKVDWAAERLVEISRRVFDEMPGKRGLPEEIVRAMIGSARKVLENRLHRGAAAGLPELAGPFLELGLLYDTAAAGPWGGAAAVRRM
jgi:AcrR family transcriptional regulator